jgi:hypothetical protein
VQYVTVISSFEMGTSLSVDAENGSLCVPTRISNERNLASPFRFETKKEARSEE